MVQAQVWLDGSRGNVGILRDAGQEYREAVDVEIDAGPTVRLGRFDNLGIEHALVILCRGHGITSAQMDVVVAIDWHGISPYWISGWVEMNLAALSGSTCGARTWIPEASSWSKNVTLLSRSPQPRTMPWMAICSARFATGMGTLYSRASSVARPMSLRARASAKLGGSN